MIKAIIYDLDGTIVDSMSLLREVFKLLLKRFKIVEEDETDFSVYEEMIINEGRNVFAHPSKFGWMKFLWNVGKNLGLSPLGRLKFIRAMKQEYIKREGTIKPFDGAVEIVRNLHNKYKQGIVTYAKIKGTTNRLKRFGIYDSFDIILTADKLANLKIKSKPFPDPILYVIKELNVLPEETIVIGDMDVDILSGKSAGCITVGVLTGVSSKKDIEAAGADYIIDDITKFPEIIDAIN